MCAELPLPSLENWYDAGHSNYSSCCWTASWDAASLLRGIFDAPPTRRLSAPRLALPVNRLQGLNELWEILLFHAPDTIRRIVEKRDGAAVDDTHEVGAAVASDDSAGADEHDCQVSGVLFAEVASDCRCYVTGSTSPAVDETRPSSTASAPDDESELDDDLLDF